MASIHFLSQERFLYTIFYSFKFDIDDSQALLENLVCSIRLKNISLRDKWMRRAYFWTGIYIRNYLILLKLEFYRESVEIFMCYFYFLKGMHLYLIFRIRMTFIHVGS